MTLDATESAANTRTAAMSPATHSSQESSTCHHKHIIRDGLFLWNIIQPSVHQ